MSNPLDIFAEPATDTQTYRGLEKTVSLFGDLDATIVNDDPFFIAPDTYWAICTDATVRQNDNGDNALILKWQIDQPDSDFHEKTITDYFTLVPPETSWDELDSKQKDKVKFLKRRLRRAFGIAESELNTVRPSELISCGAYIQIVEGWGKKGTASEGKKFSNIRDAMTKELFEEENGNLRQVGNDIGL